MDRLARTAYASLVALLLFGIGLAILGNRQDRPRSNDRVLAETTSPDGAVQAFLVMRVADSLSADVLKVFVVPAGATWSDGEMLMLGRRFSHLRELHWTSDTLLCLDASEDGLEERKSGASAAGRDVRFIVRPSIEECYSGTGGA